MKLFNLFIPLLLALALSIACGGSSSSNNTTTDPDPDTTVTISGTVDDSSGLTKPRLDVSESDLTIEVINLSTGNVISDASYNGSTGAYSVDVEPGTPISITFKNGTTTVISRVLDASDTQSSGDKDVSLATHVQALRVLEGFVAGTTSLTTLTTNISTVNLELFGETAPSESELSISNTNFPASIKVSILVYRDAAADLSSNSTVVGLLRDLFAETTLGDDADASFSLAYSAIYQAQSVLATLHDQVAVNFADDEDLGHRFEDVKTGASGKKFKRISSFIVATQIDENADTDDETAAEIVAVSDNGMILVYSDSPSENIGFVDITTPSSPVADGVVELGGEPTSVAVKGDYVLVGINSSENFIDTSGSLAVVDMTTRAITTSIDLGGQPDSVAVSPDKNYAVIAIENERDEDLGDGIPPQLPAGFVVVVDISDSDPANWTSTNVTLTGLDTMLFNTDPEPEYVDINSNNIAVVTLQENNHIVLIDCATGEVTNNFSAGNVDLTKIDATEEDPAIISPTESQDAVVREPDGVAWIDTTYFATADEGDMDGGSRGFTIFNTSGEVVYTSGSDLDHMAIRYGHYPDGRSGNKGNEPENVEYAEYDGRKLLFVNSERSSLVFVYDVADPSAPVFQQVLPTGIGPEGGLAIPSRDLLVVASEEDARDDKVRSVLNIYDYADQKPTYPTLKSVDRTDGTPIPWSAMSGLSADNTNSNTLYALDDSFYGENRIFTIDISGVIPTITKETYIQDTDGVFASFSTDSAVEDADLFDDVDLAAMINSDNTVNIDGEGIAKASDGGFWIASEGAGTIGDTASRPIEKLNFIFKTDSDGVIEEVITLPSSISGNQVRFGFEGVTEYDGKAYVAFQRAWGNDEYPRIGIYDTEDESWEFVFYPLDAATSQNGGWVGLSDITSIGSGNFLVIERDNQGGPDAAIKRLYQIDLNGVSDGETVSKTLVRDLMSEGDLSAPGGLTYEKIEGLAVLSNNYVYIINDNDGVDDNSGETQLMNLGNLLGDDMDMVIISGEIDDSEGLAVSSSKIDFSDLTMAVTDLSTGDAITNFVFNQSAGRFSVKVAVGTPIEISFTSNSKKVLSRVIDSVSSSKPMMINLVTHAQALRALNGFTAGTTATSTLTSNLETVNTELFGTTAPTEMQFKATLEDFPASLHGALLVFQEAAMDATTNGDVIDSMNTLMASTSLGDNPDAAFAVAYENAVLASSDLEALHEAVVLENAADEDILEILENARTGATSMKFVRISSFIIATQLESSANIDTETAAEIVAVTDDNSTLIYSDSPLEAVGFVDITDPANPVAANILMLDGEPTSVAVQGDYALVGINTSEDFINVSGNLDVIDIDSQSIVHSIALGGQPDAIAVSPDKNYAAVVIENERDEDLTVDGVEGGLPQLPAGFLVVVDMSDDTPSNWTSVTISLNGLADHYPTDPEPEYVDINENNYAVVSMQENNHLVIVDLVGQTVSEHFYAGNVDLSQIDTIEEDPAIISANTSATAIPREADGVAWIDTTYFATADEGDLDGGSRGFTIYNVNGDIVYTSASDLDHMAIRYGHYPDGRSGNKGNEPENIEYAEFGDQKLLFVNSERSSLVFVYEVSDPTAPNFLQVLPTGAAPEGGLAIPDSNLLVVASEEDARDDKIRSVLNIYKYDDQKSEYPTLRSADRSDGTPIPWSAMSGLAAGSSSDMLYALDDSFFGMNRIFKINLLGPVPTIDEEITIMDSNDVFASFSTDSVTSDANLFDDVDLAAMINSDKSVNIDGEGIAVSGNGGFWIASEGAGTVTDVENRPIEKLNFLFKTDDTGVIEEVVSLPTTISDNQVRFGFEGVAEYSSNVYVAFQRAWGDDENPRIGIYNWSEDSWEFVFYPLETATSQNGGWVGLSDITSLGDGTFQIIERDNQGGPDAAIKRLYTVDLSSYTDGETVTKTLVRDLMTAGDLSAPGGLTYEKIEGGAVLPNGDVYIINDNDGVDDNSGETQLINLGDLY